MTQVVASNTNNIVKVYSVGVQGTPGAPGPSGSLQPSNSGSFSITGSLIISGSGTFTNIGPAQFTGSVSSVNGFTGSLSGTATTASYISPTFISASAASSGFVSNTSTGSLMVTGSVSLNTLTFTKGNNSTFNLTVDTGSAFPYTGSTRIRGDIEVHNDLGLAHITLLNDADNSTWEASSIEQFYLVDTNQTAFLNFKNVSTTKESQISWNETTGILRFQELYGGALSLESVGGISTTGSLKLGGGATGSLQGTASFATSASYAITASYALNGGGGSTNTGSLMVTGSVSSNTLTFTKGDGSTFNLTVNTGSSGTIPTLAQVTAQGSTTGNVLTIQGMTFKSGSTFPGITANSTFIGYQSGDNSDNNAAFNVGVGYRTLFNNNTGQNVALGARSLENGISGENIGIGYLSGNNIKGPQNIGIGNGTLQYAYSASQNIAIGTTALPFAASTETEASSNKEGNIAIGYAALATAVRGRYNTIIGTSAYTTIANLGNQNTSLGYLNSTSGSYNITIGTSNVLSGYGEYNIVIGNTNNFTNLSNSVIIGNAGNIKFRSTGSVTTLFEDTVISGSLTVSGSEVLTLVPVSPLPSGVAAGSFAVSGSTPPRPYFFDGTSWVALI